MFTSPQTAAAFAAAQQAVADGEQVFVARLPWAPEGPLDAPKPGGWHPETGAVIQAVESAGWRLDHFTFAAPQGARYGVGLFRRDLR